MSDPVPVPILCGSDGEEDPECQTPPTPPTLTHASEGVATEREGSPLQNIVGDFRNVLDEFRDSWQRELKGQTTKQQQPQQQGVNDLLTPLAVSAKSEIEQQTLAESLFRTAVELEQRGKVYDALPYYRKAVQIVPDIEFKFYEHQKLKAAPKVVDVQKTFTGRHGALPEDGDDVEALVDDLYEKFQLDLARDYDGRLLLSSRDSGVISTEVHISELPAEILLYILRWVVSAQLDLHSLEQCAAVCKGLYLCARDEELWRLACLKVWGVNLGNLADPSAPAPDLTEQPDAPLYTSWRQMYIERERLLFNGCYISKTTYLRMGENSFQDQYYRPVQLVEYYRYVRFLPDGTVYMMTTADEPAQGVTKLKQLQQLRPDVLRGHYRLYGSTVTILLQKQQHQRLINTGAHQYARQRRSSSALNDDFNCTKYCIEFRIMSTPKRKFSQLVWLHYSVVQTRNKVETSSEFELTASKYPPLWFSPVRSYHLDADAPLA